MSDNGTPIQDLHWHPAAARVEDRRRRSQYPKDECADCGEVDASEICECGAPKCWWCCECDEVEVYGGVQPVPCPGCDGTGEFELPDGRTQKCEEWDCGGTGQVMGFAIEIDGERHESTEKVNY